jgi:nitrate/nitrite transporter NarK
MPNTKTRWIVSFVIATILVCTIGVSSQSIFKPIPATIRTQTVEHGIGPGAGTYVITHETKGYKANPLDVPVKVGTFIVWIIAYVGLLGALIPNVIVRVIVSLCGVPLMAYFVFAAYFIKNFNF